MFGLVLGAGAAGPARAKSLFVAGTNGAPVSLGAVPCSVDGPIYVGAARVRPWEHVVCTSTQSWVWANGVDVAADGELRLQAWDVTITGPTRIAAGSTFVASPEGAPAPWGREDCAPGARECNPCVEDVGGTFLSLFGDGPYEQTTHAWHFDPDGSYPPQGLVPQSAFDHGDVKAHVQTLVRTNSAERPIALVYSGCKSCAWKASPGVLVLVDDALEIERMYHTWDIHPTGLVNLGTMLLYGDKGAPEVTGTTGYVVRMFPLDTGIDFPATHFGYLRLPDPGLEPGRPTPGGGMTMIALDSGGFLLVTTGPGGRKKRKFTDFFYVLPEPGYDGPRPLGTLTLDDPESLEFAVSVEHLARWELDAENDGGPRDKAFDFSENASGVVECGTGDLYLIHSGSKRGLAGRPTFYRLSRVTWESGVGPQLEPVAWGTLPETPKCTGRASATAWADGGGKMELYCSEYRMLPAGDDDVRFTRRYLP